MHETNKRALGGAFRLNQNLKDAKDQHLGKRFSSQTELSKYSASILPLLHSNRKDYDEHISNIDPHKELSKAVSNFRGQRSYIVPQSRKTGFEDPESLQVKEPMAYVPSYHSWKPS